MIENGFSENRARGIASTQKKHVALHGFISLRQYLAIAIRRKNGNALGAAGQSDASGRACAFNGWFFGLLRD
jgi:hypothetical protein